eukprot:97556-Prymnesium_polylepis.1
MGTEGRPGRCGIRTIRSDHAMLPSRTKCGLTALADRSHNYDRIPYIVMACFAVFVYCITLNLRACPVKPLIESNEQLTPYDCTLPKDVRYSYRVHVVAG